jgi:predicted amidohydrolase
MAPVAKARAGRNNEHTFPVEIRMQTWNIAGVQLDVRLGDNKHNLERIRTRLHDAARLGARLIVFPECALTGYCFDSKDEAWPHAEPIPGPSTAALAQECRALNVFAAVGMLEAGPGAALYNACALIGPAGVMANYRKIHLPFLGVDRFTTPGDQPFAVHDLGGLRVGLTICYDGSFPEATRCLALLGADLILLPTNWPPGARSTPQVLIPARALENHVYYAAVNRIGSERGFEFIGMSRILNCAGEPLAATNDDQERILVATIDPAVARNKRIVKIPGKYELDRFGDRRPQMYGPIAAK